MTQTDTHAPQFKAAEEQTRYEDLNWFRRFLRKYTNSFSVARSSPSDVPPSRGSDTGSTNTSARCCGLVTEPGSSPDRATGKP